MELTESELESWENPANDINGYSKAQIRYARQLQTPEAAFVRWQVEHGRRWDVDDPEARRGMRRWIFQDLMHNTLSSDHAVGVQMLVANPKRFRREWLQSWAPEFDGLLWKFTPLTRAAFHRAPACMAVLPQTCVWETPSPTAA